MNTISLKVTSAFMLAGQIARAGSVVEVDETTAKDLLHRGKAVLAVAGQVKEGPKTLTTGSLEADEGEQPAAMSEAGAATSEAAEQQPEAKAPEQPKAKGKKGK